MINLFTLDDPILSCKPYILRDTDDSVHVEKVAILLERPHRYWNPVINPLPPGQ